MLFLSTHKYQEDSATQAKLLLQLKLDAAVGNSFQYCEVHMCFKNRNPIASFQATPNIGSVTLGHDHRSLVWNIGFDIFFALFMRPGQKFTSTNLEASMPATVFFSANPDPKYSQVEAAFMDSQAYEPADWGEGEPDPLYSGETCYARVISALFILLIVEVTVQNFELGSKWREYSIQKSCSFISKQAVSKN